MRAESRVLVLASPPFLLSGVAAIIYEVAWQRLLVLPSGIGSFSVSVVVAAFMAGLGLGSLLGGAWSVDLDPRRALRAFALVELAVGCFAAVSPYLYYDVLYVRGSWLYGSPGSTAIAHFLALLVPTTLMGMSLPFLVRATVGDAATASRTIGLLYGVNLVGAAVGALATPWLLMRYLGIDGAIRAGAACNALAGLAALALSARAWEPAVDETGPGAEPKSEERPGSRSFPLWLVLYGLSGFCALSLEILWFRIVDVGVKSTAFTFGTVLALYLAGLACGSLYGTTRAAGLRHPLRAFLLCQCFVAIFSGLSVMLLARLPTSLPVYSWLYDYWGKDEEFILGSVHRWRPLLTLYALFPAVLYLLPTLLMGFSFPVLQRAVQDDPRVAGRRTGMLQAANILGCVIGSLLVGMVLLRTFGTTGTLRVILGLGLVFAVAGVVCHGLRSFALPALGLLALVFALPDQRGLWLRLHGTARPESLLLEDETGVVALIPQQAPRWLVCFKGAAHSWLPYGGIHGVLGGIPAAVHPSPRDVAIIGLGSGETAWAAGCREETRSITVFETAAPQEPLLRELLRLGDRHHGLDGLLQDPRLRVVTADGRFALQQGSGRYDIIEMDALTPYLGYSGNIYSLEFFRLCESRLKPGGLLCSWAPTARVRHAILATFPHVIEFEGESVLLASDAPIPMEPRVWARRLRAEGPTLYLGEPARDEVLNALRHASVPRPLTLADTDMNRDLSPADEFLRPLRRQGRGRRPAGS